MKPLSVALAVAGWGLYLTSFWLPAVTAGCCERFPGFYAAIWASLAAFGALRDVRLLVDPMFGAMPVLLVSTNALMLLSPLGLSGGESRRRLCARLLIGMLAAVAVQILGYLWVLDLSGRQDYFFRPSGVDVGYVVWTASFAVVGLALLVRERSATGGPSGPATGRPRGPDAPGPGAVAPPPDARGQRASAAGGAGTPPRPENAPMLHQVRRPRRRGAAHARFGGTLAATARSAVLALLLAPGPLALRVGPAEAGTRAYVFGESREVAVLDADADTLEARRLRLPFETRDPYGRDVTRPVPLATVDGLLFVAYFPEPVDSYGTVRLAAVDLETLALRAAFDVQSLRMSAYATEVTTPAVHVPAGGAHVYLEVVAGIHVTPDRDALPRRRTVRLDRRTLVPTPEQPQLAAGLRGKRRVPSADGRHLFGWNPWDPRLVDIFDAATLEHLGGRDVAFEHLGPLTGRGKIADLRNDRVLLVEDRTPRGDDPARYYRFETWKEFGGDPGRYVLFTVHLRDGNRYEGLRPGVAHAGRRPDRLRRGGALRQAGVVRPALSKGQRDGTAARLRRRDGAQARAGRLPRAAGAGEALRATGLRDDPARGLHADGRQGLSLRPAVRRPVPEGAARGRLADVPLGHPDLGAERGAAPAARVPAPHRA